jgi:hypothetical protein
VATARIWESPNPGLGTDVGTYALANERPEEQLARGLMPQERHDQPPMPVELGSALDDRHDAVGTGQLEEPLDFRVGELLGKLPEERLALQLALQPALPRALILGQPQDDDRCRQGAVHDISADRRAERV